MLQNDHCSVDVADHVYKVITLNEEDEIVTIPGFTNVTAIDGNFIINPQNTADNVYMIDTDLAPDSYIFKVMFIHEVKDLWQVHTYYENVTAIFNYIDWCDTAQFYLPIFNDMETSVLRQTSEEDYDMYQTIYDPTVIVTVDGVDYDTLYICGDIAVSI